LISINLEPIANQSITIQIDGSVYEIVLKETKGVMSCSIIRDNLPVIQNVRVMANHPIFPYKYLESGNFFITTQNGDYPDYAQFGSSQNLLYATQAEIDEVRNAA
jgi:hypothetical protein